MRRIEVNVEIGYPPEAVFIALRDRIEELSHFMPHVEYMKVLEREDAPPLTRVYNRWQGTKDNVPAVARPFISRDVVGWFDRAEWSSETLACTWRIEPVKFKKLFDCHGTTTLAHSEGGSLFTLVVNLELDLQKVPGLPKFLARRVQGPVESFVAKSLTPNLASLANAVQAYFDESGLP